VVRRDGTRVLGRRAEALPAGATGPDDQSHPVLRGAGETLAAAGWQRAPLTRAQRWPPGPAVYAMHDRDAVEAVYFGETTDLPGRAAAHASELESGLLGWHFWHTGRAPRAQYRTEVTA